MKKIISKLLFTFAFIICGIIVSNHSVKAADTISIRVAYYYLNEAGETVECVRMIDNVETELTFIEFYEKYMRAGTANLDNLKTPSYWCSFPKAGREKDGCEYSEDKIYQSNYTIDYFAVYPGYTWSYFGFETIIIPDEMWLDSGTGFMCCMPDGASEKQIRDSLYAAAQNCSWIKTELDYYGKYEAYLFSEGGEWSYPYYILDIDGTSANISASKKKLYTGQKDFRLSLVNVPEYDAEEDSYKVIWESSNPKVAAVDENGVVTALKKGKTTITGRCEDASFKCSITVVNPYISKTQASLKAKKTLKLKVYGSEVVKWSTSNAKVAKVSGTGKVTALKAGTVTITAKCANGKTYSCTLTVTN